MIKLNLIERYSPALLEGNQAFSFVNFASIGSFLEQPSNAVAYFCDGMLMSTFMSRLTGRAVGRVSFDFTSIADPVFSSAQEQGKRVYFVGARQAELELFVGKIAVRYPNLKVVGHHNGYFSAHQAADLHADIRRSQTQILIVGLGAGLQERFVQNALHAGFSGVAFTCGGFIRQEATATQQYYPALIDRLHLRALYRMYREPHTIRRYLIDYPSNFFQLLAMINRRKLSIDIRAA